jgi:hypothetical protein
VFRVPCVQLVFGPLAPSFAVASRFDSKFILCETGRRSGDRVQNHPAIRDERHEETQHAAQNHGRDLAVLDVHPDEHEALEGENRGSQDRQQRLPMERGGDDEPYRANELYQPQGHPGFSRQGGKGRDILAYLVEHEDLHDARRCVQKRGEDLQHP